MTLNFDHIFARIKNAQSHRETMYEMHEKYREQHPVKQFHKSNGNTLHLYAQATSPYPYAMSIKFGEWANGLRAALDSLFYEIAIYDTGENPPTRAGSRTFPIIREEEKFSQHPSIKGLHPWTVQTLKTCQPFNSVTGETGNALFWLNEIARIDRHRHLYDFAMIIRGIQVNVPGPLASYTSPELVTTCDEKTSFIFEDSPLELASITFHTPPPPKLRSGIDIFYDVGFDVPGWLLKAHEGYQWRFDYRMTSVEEMVEKLTLLFSLHLEDRTEFEGTVSYIDGKWVKDY